MSSSTPAPKAVGRAAVLALLVRLVVLALAVVAVHDFAVDRGWASGRSWVQATLDKVDGLTPGVGTDIVAGLLVLVGLWLLVTAFRPARRTHDRVPTEADVDVWVARRTVAQIAEQAARWSPGVEDASATVKRRKVRVEVTALDDDARARAEREVEHALAGYSTRPVTVTRKKDDRED